MNTQEIKSIINKLTEKQRDVLGAIAIGMPGGHHPKTLNALFKKGLIIFEEKKASDRFGTFIYNVPYVPIHIHIAWCEWCSDNFSETDEG